MPGLSLIIPTYNRAEYLRDTLKSVAAIACPSGIDREVLVIDNNCTDSTQAIVAQAAKSSPCPVRHIVETQQGLCFGRNRGIAEARYEHLAFLDDDIRVSPQWVSAYFEAVERHGANAVAGPVRPIFLGRKPEYIAGRALEIISSGYSRKGDESKVLPHDCAHELPGCNFGVSKAAAEQIGGFRQDLDRIGDRLLAGGDTDFGMRLVAADMRTAYHPKCWIEHVIVPEKTTKAYLRRRAYGLGATRRLLWSESDRLPFGRRARYIAGAARLVLEAVGFQLTGRPVEGFNRQLESLESWGFVLTRHIPSASRVQSALPSGLAVDRSSGRQRQPPVCELADDR